MNMPVVQKLLSGHAPVHARTYMLFGPPAHPPIHSLTIHPSIQPHTSSIH